jgi:hypothetical protein
MVVQSYVDQCVTELCRKQTDVIFSHRNLIVLGFRPLEAMHRKFKRLILTGGQT